MTIIQQDVVQTAIKKCSASVDAEHSLCPAE